MVRRGLLLLLLFLVAVGCGDWEGRRAQPVVLTAADNGGEVTLKPGQLLIVQLEANPDTGYEWKAARFRAKVLTLAGEPKFTPYPGAYCCGKVGGVIEFRFRARHSGKTELLLEYRLADKRKRQGVAKPAIPPAAVFVVTVIVH